MELGPRIKAARLEKGLSQRQLCGDYMTRNMLSLIENGTARPSVDTLEYLARQLERPVSYFLDEPSVASALDDARAALALGDLPGLRQALDAFREEGFVEERQLLEFYWHLGQAEAAMEEGRQAYACTLLERALALHGLYITKPLVRRARVLLTLAGGQGAAEPEDAALLALAIQADTPERKKEILSAAQNREDPRWCRLMAQAEMALGEYENALLHLDKCVQDRETWAAREICCRELGDFKGAYEAACKLR